MIGERVAHYRVQEKLGAGGMGVVYRAHDERLDRDVALKFLSLPLSLDEEAKRRLVHEARSASALDHPNICTIHDVDETPSGRLFIAMALYEGETLAERMQRGPMTPDEAAEIVAQIADGLQAAHAAGILHRDVKPANVMLTRGGLAKLLDFGLAKVSGVDLTRSGAMLGTLAYMSPEQARGEELDARTDVWALGVVLYELLAGERPFQGEEVSVLQSILADEPPPLARRAEVPRELAAIAHRALAKDPARRYATAGAMRDALNAWRASAAAPAPARRPVVPVLSAALVALLVLVGWQWRRSERARTVRSEVLPEIERLIGETSVFSEGRAPWTAFDLATEAEKVVPDDPVLARLWPQVAHPLDVDTEPEGARILVRPYDDPDGPWRAVGRTPVEGLRIPRGFARLRFELDGYAPVETAYWNHPIMGTRLAVTLHTPAETPEGMVWVAPSRNEISLPGLRGLEPHAIDGFWIDRCEVSNADYQRFVDAGGYRDPRYWTEPFVLGERTLDLAEAMQHFTDRTGQPGPANWEVGTYPEGAARLPVGGVSWYEAAAYARWAKKELPTVFHWNAVAFTWATPAILPLANLASDGPVPVDSSRAMHAAGALNLAGNAREWCRNASSREGQRFILGGGWNDPPYAFNDAYAQPVFDRSETNGFRCIRTTGPGDPQEEDALSCMIVRASRDFRAEEPVGDERFEAILAQFAYDPTPLDAKIEEVRQEDGWTRQRVAFESAYGERMFAYLFLPDRGTPPYETVVFFPGSNGIQERSSANLRTDLFEHFLRSGRAVIQPIYAGTFERGGEIDSDQPDTSVRYRDYVLKWAKDLRRSVDYLETRDDVDTSRLAYWGVSWGGRLGPILLAVEPRLRVGMLYVAGLSFQRALPEADPFQFAGRVRVPVLMINGEYDFFFPVETSQRPLFEHLGTPAKDKRWVVYPGGHSVPQNKMIAETLAWLDRYLGRPRGT